MAISREGSQKKSVYYLIRKGYIVGEVTDLNEAIVGEIQEGDILAKKVSIIGFSED